MNQLTSMILHSHRSSSYCSLLELFSMVRRESTLREFSTPKLQFKTSSCPWIPLSMIYGFLWGLTNMRRKLNYELIYRKSYKTDHRNSSLSTSMSLFLTRVPLIMITKIFIYPKEKKMFLTFYTLLSSY